MTMITVNIHEAKTHLSKYIAMAEKGERVVVCKHNIPVIELKPVKKKGERLLGPLSPERKFEIPDSFFEPLPDDIMEAFTNPKIFPGEE